MTDIIINSQKYILEDILKLIPQGVKVIVDPTLVDNMDTAVKDHMVTAPVIIADGARYKALVMPGVASKQPLSKFNLLSKIVLKKAKYVEPPPPVRIQSQDNYNDDRRSDNNWNRPYRPMDRVDSARMVERFNNPNRR